MKYWEEIMKKDMTYDEVLTFKGFYFTRPEWDGFHFFSARGEHKVLLKTGEVITVSPDLVWNRDSKDWMLVSITKEAVRILEENFRMENKR